jgi:hypothetical protein
MQTWTGTVSANNPGESNFVEPMTIDLGGSFSVLVTCAMQQVNQVNVNSPWWAELNITSYVQNGNPQNGGGQLLSGDNISSVTFGLQVINAGAQATGVIFNTNT